MRIRSGLAFVVVLGTGAVVFACAKKDDAAPPQTPASTYPAQGYGQTTGATGTTPAGYAPTGAAQAAPTATTAAVPGQMATPGPLAFPCTNDSTCGTHHCNVPAGHCAFPCQSDTDCITNTHCIAGIGVCGQKPAGQ